MLCVRAPDCCGALIPALLKAGNDSGEGGSSGILYPRGGTGGQQAHPVQGHQHRGAHVTEDGQPGGIDEAAEQPSLEVRGIRGHIQMNE